VHLAIQRCGIGSDLVSSPACTRLVVLDYEVPNHYRDLRNENGITLKVTVVAMVKRLESCYYTHVSHARSCVRQWSEDEVLDEMLKIAMMCFFFFFLVLLIRVLSSCT
jgi:hypothetical protein